jgi:hypothetical protein
MYVGLPGRTFRLRILLDLRASTAPESILLGLSSFTVPFCRRFA